MRNEMARTKHVSICPVAANTFGCDWPAENLPLTIGDSISVADVSPIIRETNFSPLSPLLVRESQIDGLKNIRYALIREFECDDEQRPLEDEKSANALYSLHIGLKVIRPCAGVFQVFHYDLSQTGSRLPRGERNNRGTIVCDCETLNSVRWTDVQELADLGSSILKVLKTPSLPISQAMQSLEIGYRSEFVNARHLPWVVGLDALFTSTEWRNQGAKVAVGRIEDLLGGSFQIYPPPQDPWQPPVFSLTLHDALPDIYQLRNHLAHGSWPDKQWVGKVCRRSANGLEDTYYGTVLSEAASAILRGCLKKILAEARWVDLFNDKTKMNTYFASHGLIRERKSSKNECNLS
jgi:hypothetical protein